MSMTDPIADMLTRIRNALQVSKPEVSMPSSKVKKAILDVLVSEGFVTSYDESGDIKKEITVKLKYYQGQPVIDEIKRTSKPGRRVYFSNEDLPTVKEGYGITVVSTSKGVMTGKQARQEGIGGELVCTVY